MKFPISVLALVSTATALITVSNFSASANYQNNMIFRADLTYESPSTTTNTAITALGFCNGYVNSCQVAGGPYGPFVATKYTGFGGCGAPLPGWSWNLRVNAYNTATNKSGFNLVVEYDNDASAGKVYACRFFSYDQLVCDNSHLGPSTETGNWLAVPPAFDMVTQTTSACPFDATGSSSAVPTATARG